MSSKQSCRLSACRSTAQLDEGLPIKKKKKKSKANKWKGAVTKTKKLQSTKTTPNTALWIKYNWFFTFPHFAVSQPEERRGEVDWPVFRAENIGRIDSQPFQ